MKKRIGPRTAGILRAGSVMALAGLSMQGIGVFFNAFLTGALGEAGMGLLSLTMSVYGFAVTFATSGVTLTITRLLAENLGRQDFAGARR